MRIKKAILTEILLIVILAVFILKTRVWDSANEQNLEVSVNQDGIIKWVDFNVSAEALSAAYKHDINTYEESIHLNWIELLAYAAAKNGGNVNKNALKDIDKAANRIKDKKETISTITSGLKNYDYFLQAYKAVLGGYVGEYKVQTADGNWEDKYGLKAFSPIAKGFPYEDYDDFGASRSYGYNRPHLGHDMMGQVGTPIVAIESGYVEVLGWNQYGGWRIGIRSFDGKRYYYYAHLRQNYPYADWLKEGEVVTAGDVIGYMGRTGYSAKENVNNIEVVHLHVGVQLIFAESQKDGSNEIWIDCYQLANF